MSAKPLDAGVAAALQNTIASGTVLVVERGDGAYTNVLLDGRHMLLADEPGPAGDDRGPNPYELLLMSLGACTSITLRMYAERKKWPLTGVDVALEFGERGREQSTIVRRIELHGALDAGQRERLLQVAEACPVHKLLTGRIDVATTLAD